MKPKVKTFASFSDGITPWEEASRKIAYQAAAESIVLLKNDGALPVIPGRIALYGAGARKTVKGGVGSGEVNERHSISIEEGLEQAGFTVTTKSWLQAYDALYEAAEQEYTQNFRKKLKKLSITTIINLMNDPFIPPVGQPISQLDIDGSRTEICLYVVARQAGEGSDRRLEDNVLAQAEKDAIALCAKRYDRTIVAINAGSSLDMGFLEEIPGINAVIFYCQQGGMGGAALADLLCAKQVPSGKLASTWAKQYTDLPGAMDYGALNGNLKEEYYREGIYVGYRYFDSFRKEPRYPFGYGLSYTSFSYAVTDARVERDKISLQVRVTNTGSEYPGQEVMQLYVSCPQSRELPKEYQRLVAFGKTRLLQPGEEQLLTLFFRAEDMASYHEGKAATVLEAGEYLLRLGNCSRGTAVCAVVELDNNATVSQHERICRRKQPVEEITAPVLELESIDPAVTRLELRAEDIPQRSFCYENPPIDRSPEIAAMMDKLSLNDMVRVTIGAGNGDGRYLAAPGAAGNTTGKLLRKGIPNVVLADGPAGVRLNRCSVLLRNGKIKPVEPAIAMMRYLPDFIKGFLVADPGKGKLLYQFTTAFPVEMALAQTWNTALLRRVGESLSQEMRAYGVSYWLAPAMNIHRNPLCGRNFEYFSEDPILSGICATAMTRGVQSVPGSFVTVKHFACNNQEDNRNRTNANVNERALREIYLKGFEIAVRRANPGAVMSSYNKVNGVYTPNSYDLLTKALRNEWGFRGLVMTDWYSTGNGLGDHAQALKAGNDLIMPGGAGAYRRIQKALKKGEILNTDVQRCCANVLRGILSSGIRIE